VKTELTFRLSLACVTFPVLLYFTGQRQAAVASSLSLSNRALMKFGVRVESCPNFRLRPDDFFPFPISVLRLSTVTIASLANEPSCRKYRMRFPVELFYDSCPWALHGSILNCGLWPAFHYEPSGSADESPGSGSAPTADEPNSLLVDALLLRPRRVATTPRGGTGGALLLSSAALTNEW
jgi:hypothetical protein